MPRRLRPTAEIHPDAILVGDPGRAMALAQLLTEAPKMANHARGLWGYSGTAASGHGLTVQTTGMGGPSAALVLADLAELGVGRAVRVGTCTALDPGLRPGDLLFVREARPWAADHRGAGPAAYPDEVLTARLSAGLGERARSASVASLDALHPSPGEADSAVASSGAGAPGPGTPGPGVPSSDASGPGALGSASAGQVNPDADAADMQTAALFAAGTRFGVAVAAVLIVTEAEGSDPLDDDALADRVASAARAGEFALFNP